MAEEKFEEMSLIGHLTELRKRLLWSFLYILLVKSSSEKLYSKFIYSIASDFHYHII